MIDIPWRLSEEALRIATERQEVWEYRLFAQVIIDEVAATVQRLRYGRLPPITLEVTERGSVVTKVDGRQQDPAPTPVKFFELATWAASRLSEVPPMGNELQTLVNADHTGAFGAIGESGNPSEIENLARAIAGCHCRASEWADRVRRTPVDDRYAALPLEIAALGTTIASAVEEMGPAVLQEIERILKTPPDGSLQTIRVAVNIDTAPPDGGALRTQLNQLTNEVNRLIQRGDCVNEETKKRYGAMNEQQGFVRIVGQEEVLGRLRAFADLYRKKGMVPGHVLLVGPDGYGKRSIAHAFAEEHGCSFRELPSGLPMRPGDVAAILTNLGAGDVLVISDMNRLGGVIRQVLTPALREFQIDVQIGKPPRAIKLDLKTYTVIGTVRKEAECPAGIRECFPLVVTLGKYSQVELERIAQARSRANGFVINAPAARLVAQLAKGSPHQVDVLIQRLAVLGEPSVNEQDAADVLSTFGFRVSSAETLAVPGDLDELSGVDFERLVTSLLERMGFRPEMTKASGDGGIDIIAILDRPIIGGRYLIQCKRFAPGTAVGSATVREFYGALVADRAATKGILITTSGFSDQAREFAAGLPLELIDGNGLRELLSEYAPGSSARRGIAFDVAERADTATAEGGCTAPRGEPIDFDLFDGADTAAAVKEIFSQMPANFNADAAKGMNSVIQFNLTGDGEATYYVAIKDGVCTLNEDAHPSPNMTMTMAARDYVDMISGKLNGQVAFTSGKLKIAGDLGLAMKMQSLFNRSA